MSYSLKPGVVSGEDYLVDGNTQSGAYIMPDKKWKNFEKSHMVFVNLGYSDINNFDWGYIK